MEQRPVKPLPGAQAAIGAEDGRSGSLWARLLAWLTRGSEKGLKGPDGCRH